MDSSGNHMSHHHVKWIHMCIPSCHYGMGKGHVWPTPTTQRSAAQHEHTLPPPIIIVLLITYVMFLSFFLKRLKLLGETSSNDHEKQSN